MTPAVAIKDTVDVDCETPSEQVKHLSPNYYRLGSWRQRGCSSVTMSSSGWQADLKLDSEIQNDANDRSSAGLWDITSDYDKVRATLEEFQLSKAPLRERRRVLARLAELNDLLAADPEEPKLQPISVGACLRFLSVNTDLRFPDIMASPAGTVVCQWRKDCHRNLTIEFLPDSSLNYLVFAPGPERTIRVSGRCSTAELRQLINPLNTEPWTTIDAR